MMAQHTRMRTLCGEVMLPGTAVGIAVALAVALCGRSAAAQTPVPPAAPDFANAVEQSDAYEVLAARDALAQSRNARVKAFAQQMIDDHTRLSESIGQAAAASGLPAPPQAMSSDQAALLSALQSLRGVEFDKAYARQQVLAHRQAIAVVQSYAGAGSDTNLREAAKAALPVIEHHLEMAEQLHATLGGS